MDAVLSALAALAKENPTLANMLAKPSLERDREFFFFFLFVGDYAWSFFFLTSRNSSLVSKLTPDNRIIAYSLPRHARTPCTA